MGETSKDKGVSKFITMIPGAVVKALLNYPKMKKKNLESRTELNERVPTPCTLDTFLKLKRPIDLFRLSDPELVNQGLFIFTYNILYGRWGGGVVNFKRIFDRKRRLIKKRLFDRVFSMLHINCCFCVFQ